MTDRYLFLDLETTGTDEHSDLILEVGIVLTDETLNGFISDSWVVNDGSAYNRLCNSAKVVQDMHAANGLASELKAGRGAPVDQVEQMAINLLQLHGKKHDYILAGSGVAHFDRRFIDAQMPKLSKWLRYYCIDVGILRRSLVLCGREDLLMEKATKPHRALADAQLHLEELRHIKAALS